jgi:hypothetical protein
MAASVDTARDLLLTMRTDVASMQGVNASRYASLPNAELLD